jgi:hypothetical protein
MSDILAAAGDILRANASSNAQAVSFVTAAALVISTPGGDKTPVEQLLYAANLIDPVCPHCGKRPSEPVENP